MTEPITIGAAAANTNRRAMILFGVAVLLILAKVVLPGLLSGGDAGAATDLSFAPPSTTTVPVAQVTPELTATPVDAKNPFTPLVSTGVVAASSGAVVVTGASSSPATTASSSSEPTQATPPLAETAQPLPSLPVQANRVSLLEVYRDAGDHLVASMRVNDTTYQVENGQEFAVIYRVLSLDVASRCAQLLVGTDQFALCEGDEILK